MSSYPTYGAFDQLRGVLRSESLNFLGCIPILKDVCTNLTFAGPRRRMLYITGGKSIFKIPLAV